MNRQPHSDEREIIVADAIGPVVAELRLVDVADYIAFIRMEHFSCIADIVDSAAELFFMPGTLKMGHGGEAHVGWTEVPKIALDLELRPHGATVYFVLTLTAHAAAVEVNYVAFDTPAADPLQNTHMLKAALAASRLRQNEKLALPTSPR